MHLVLADPVEERCHGAGPEVGAGGEPLPRPGLQRPPHHHVPPLVRVPQQRASGDTLAARRLRLKKHSISGSAICNIFKITLNNQNSSRASLNFGFYFYFYLSLFCLSVFGK